MLRPRRRSLIVKGRTELAAMKAAGQLAARCLEWIIQQVEPGITTQEIDDLQMDFARRHHAVPAPLNYRGFPKSICTSVNEVICHGIPTAKRVLRDGDIVGIDVTLVLDGFHGDTATTVAVGTPSRAAVALMQATLEANRLGVAAVRAGVRLGDIGHAIQSHVEPLGYSVVRDFVGHGIGREFHEDPQVPHFGEKGRGVRLPVGSTFTIEPMINAGTHELVILDDGWTAVTADRKLSAQYEHTVAVTQEGALVLTVQNAEGTWEPPGRWRPPSH